MGSFCVREHSWKAVKHVSPVHIMWEIRITKLLGVVWHCLHTAATSTEYDVNCISSDILQFLLTVHSGGIIIIILLISIEFPSISQTSCSQLISIHKYLITVWWKIKHNYPRLLSWKANGGLKQEFTKWFLWQLVELHATTSLDNIHQVYKILVSAKSQL